MATTTDPAQESRPVDAAVAPVLPTTFVNPLLIADLIVEAPLTGGASEPGTVTDLETGDQEDLFSLSAIDGTFLSSVSDSAIADEGSAVLVYAAQQPDEGLDEGTLDVGLLVRPWEGSGFGEQVDIPLLSLDDPYVDTVSYSIVRPQVIKAFPVFDRVVVIDFVDDRWWLIESDGTVTESDLGRRIVNDPCPPEERGDTAGDNDCIEYYDIADLTTAGAQLGSFAVDRSNLVLVTVGGRTMGGSAAVVRLDLESGAVTGPVTWPQPGWAASVLSGSQFVVGSCVGTVVCIAPFTPTSSSTGEPVMNRFDPLSLEIDYRPVPDHLGGLEPYPLADGLLWTGGPTVFTDLDGNERWRLGDHLGIGFVDLPAADAESVRSGFMYATNSSGEVFEIDLESGDISGELEMDTEGVIGVSDRWLVAGKVDGHFSYDDGRRYFDVVVHPRLGS